MDDLISREAAINTIDFMYKACEGSLDDFRDLLIEGFINLPPVQPTQSNTPNALKALDCVSRQSAIGEIQRFIGYIDQDIINRIKIRIGKLPSAQPDEEEYRKCGEWDMFELITSAWYGKQCYFAEENNMVYSRISHRTMTVNDAICEFLRGIGDDGCY